MFKNKRKNPNKTPHNTQKWTTATRSSTSKSTWCVLTRMDDGQHSQKRVVAKKRGTYKT
jgi:hypothetical protein